MKHYATEKSINDAVEGGGLLVVAQWEAKAGEADKVAAILLHTLAWNGLAKALLLTAVAAAGSFAASALVLRKSPLRTIV